MRRVEKMGIPEAVGQMFLVDMQGTSLDEHTEEMITERNLGGVIFFARNFQSAEQTNRLTTDLQNATKRTASRIPLLISVDEEGGRVSRIPWVTKQLPAEEIGKTGDPTRAQGVARDIGREIKAVGINTDFAPVLDTGHGAAIGNRSFGDDPEVVARMGAAAIKGFREAGIVATGKHFPNHGDAQVDSHFGLPVVDHDLQTIRSRDLPPFKKAVEADVPMIMVGHLIYPAIDSTSPTSLSSKAVQFLREELNYNGVLVTDDLAMEGARQGKTLAQAAVKAVEAGMDMLIVQGDGKEQIDAYNAVVKAVTSREITREQINASVQRILTMKTQYSL